ncbi:type IX secretion system outer membrane channel protein PorV [candidate division KSB1 bacterium]
MRRNLTVLAVFAMLFLMSGNLFAQSEATAEFLMIAPGARAGGMGETGVALANDAYATYWNPAGLGKLRGKEFSGMHSNWLPQFQLGDMYYDFASYIQHFEDIGTFGASVIFLSLGEQAWTDEDGNFLGTFDSYNFSISASYGTELSENLSVGTSFKFIYMKLTDVSVGAQETDGTGSSVAVDLGLLWRPSWLNKMTVGVNLQNLGPKITFVDAAQADPIPSNLKLGFAYKAMEQEHNELTFTLDVNKLLVRKQFNAADSTHTSDAFYKALFTSWTDGGLSYQIKRMNIAAGAEYTYNEMFMLRTGYFYEDIGKRRFATFGAGIRYNIYQFDFSYIYTTGDDEHPLADTIRFSLSFILGSR